MRAYARARNQGEELDFLAVDRDSLSQLRSQMLSKTVIAIRAVLDLDPTISEEHREGIMQFAMDDSLTVANILREQSGNEVVSIEKAAKTIHQKRTPNPHHPSRQNKSNRGIVEIHSRLRKERFASLRHHPGAGIVVCPSFVHLSCLSWTIM